MPLTNTQNGAIFTRMVAKSTIGTGTPVYRERTHAHTACFFVPVQSAWAQESSLLWELCGAETILRDSGGLPTREAVVPTPISSHPYSLGTEKGGFKKPNRENITMSDLITADFHGTTLSIANHNNEPYVSAKEISEAIGLNWSPQYTKFNSDRERWGVTKIVIPAKNGQKHPTICIPLRKLPTWLLGIQPNKISDIQLRYKIIQYQNECDDVLWEYWNKANQPAKPAIEQQPRQQQPQPIIETPDNSTKAQNTNPQYWITIQRPGQPPETRALDLALLQELTKTQKEFCLVPCRHLQELASAINNASTKSIELIKISAEVTA